MDKIRDFKYEIEIKKHIERHTQILKELTKKFEKANIETLMASERALQILIECFIWFSRYFINQKYWIKTEKTRDAIDVLFQKWEINSEEYKIALQIIAFRNVLVHDYLNVEIEITEDVLKSWKYLFIKEVFGRLLKELN